MNIEEELTNISNKIDKYHKENINRASRNKYINLSYILWGFALATTGLAVTNPNAITIAIAFAFLIFGFCSLWYSSRFRVEWLMSPPSLV